MYKVARISLWLLELEYIGKGRQTLACSLPLQIKRKGKKAGGCVYLLCCDKEILSRTHTRENKNKARGGGGRELLVM